MSRKSSSIVTLVLCSVLAFTATGCGNKKTSAATTVAALDTTTSPASADTSATDTPAADATATDATATDTTAMDTPATDTTAMDSTTSSDTTAADTTATDTTASSDDLSSLASAGNCAQLTGLAQSFSAAFTGADSDIGKAAKLMKEFADRTPEDIRPDFEVLADAYTKIAGALKGVDLSSGKTPDAATLAKLTQLSSELNNAKLTKAEANISAWAAKNCPPS